MNFVLESDRISDYLKADEYIDFNNRQVQRKADDLLSGILSETEKIKTAYEFVRDEIHHSADINSELVTKTASEVLKHREGICVAKSLLLASILRYENIPAGMCYQRLMMGNTPGTGYVIHGLNAVFLSDENKWIRLDARGNKQNVDAQFSTGREKIAFNVRAECGEVDYPIIYAKPNPLVMNALQKCKTRSEYSFSISEI